MGDVHTAPAHIVLLWRMQAPAGAGCLPATAAAAPPPVPHTRVPVRSHPHMQDVRVQVQSPELTCKAKDLMTPSQPPVTTSSSAAAHLGSQSRLPRMRGPGSCAGSCFPCPLMIKTRMKRDGQCVGLHVGAQVSILAWFQGFPTHLPHFPPVPSSPSIAQHLPPLCPTTPLPARPLCSQTLVRPAPPLPSPPPSFPDSELAASALNITLLRRRLPALGGDPGPPCMGKGAWEAGRLEVVHCAKVGT